MKVKVEIMEQVNRNEREKKSKYLDSMNVNEL